MTKNEFLTVLECLVLHLEEKNENSAKNSAKNYPRTTGTTANYHFKKGDLKR